VATIDYNLVRPLRALLEERNVTRAAERLHMSQSAMSIALGRLRAHFDDPLLVRRGNLHDLSPLAERLLHDLPRAIAETEQLFALQSRFDAATSTRAFTIAGVDYAIARIMPALNQIVQREAPNVRFEFPAADAALVNSLPDALRFIDAVIMPHGYGAGQAHIDLFTDAWICLVDGESGLSDESTADELFSRPWVQTISPREGMTPAIHQLQSRGIDVTIAAVTPHFFVVPALLIGTNRIALVPESFARMAMAMQPRLRTLPAPLDLDPVRDAFWWHRDREHDSEHRWLRGILRRVSDSVIPNPDDGHTEVAIQ